MDRDTGAHFTNQFAGLASQAKTNDDIFTGLATILHQSSAAALVLVAMKEGLMLVQPSQTQQEEEPLRPGWIPIPPNIRKLRPASPVLFNTDRLPGQPDAFFGLLRELNCSTGAIYPVGAGDSLAGMFIIGCFEKNGFTAASLEPYTRLAKLAGSALEKVQTEKRLEQRVGVFEVRRAFLSGNKRREVDRERIIAEISEKLWAASGIDAILRTAMDELGRACGASEGMIQLQPEVMEEDQV